jgi:hypothetical protein
MLKVENGEELVTKLVINQIQSMLLEITLLLLSSSPTDDVFGYFYGYRPRFNDVFSVIVPALKCKTSHEKV